MIQHKSLSQNSVWAKMVIAVDICFMFIALKTFVLVGRQLPCAYVSRILPATTKPPRLLLGLGHLFMKKIYCVYAIHFQKLDYKIHLHWHFHRQKKIILKYEEESSFVYTRVGREHIFTQKRNILIALKSF